MTGGRDYIVFDGVYYRYGNTPDFALRDVSGRISRGEFIAVIGPNGSGKSTLARLINGLLIPSRGKVTVDGKDTGNPAHLQQIRRQTGYMMQNPDNQLVGVTVEEDAAFGPENLGLDPPEIRAAVDEALAVVGLDSMACRPVNLLSGGQKQLLALAGALAMKADLLVLDEPTAMLGPADKKAVLNLIKILNFRYGKTVVLVTHFMEETMPAHRVWVMNSGSIALCGPPAEVFSSYETLSGIGIDLPKCLDLAERLRKAGLELPQASTVDDLVGFICRL